MRHGVTLPLKTICIRRPRRCDSKNSPSHDIDVIKLAMGGTLSMTKMNWREGARMSSQMRVCPGSIGWVVVDQLAKRMYLRKNDGSIIKVDVTHSIPLPKKFEASA